MSSPILYLANRDKPEYLSKTFPFPHRLVSVIGGLGFLSFVSELTSDVVLIDSNPEQISYCEVILALIAAIPDLERFTEIIGAYGIPSEDNLTFIRQILCPEKYETYKRTILHTLSSNSIRYFEFEYLEPLKFYWRISESFPYSPFSSQERYRGLHDFFSTHQIRVVEGQLQFLDYTDIFTTQVANVFCITNADFQLYTPSELILERIISTSPRPCGINYHSWHRSFWLRFDQHHADALAKIVPYTKNRRVVEICTYAGYSFNKDDLRALSHTLIGSAESSQFKTYTSPSDTLVYHISLSPTDSTKEESAKKILNDARGNFTRIVILDHCRAEEQVVWLQWITQLHLHHSYRVSGLDWSGGETGFSRNIIICLELRGTSAKKLTNKST